jgi:catalase
METIDRQLYHWFRADIGGGMAVAKGLQMDLDEATAANV